MKNIFFAFFLLLNSFLNSFDLNHSKLNGILNKFVYNGLVDYQALKNDVAGLNEYLLDLKGLSAEKLNGFSEDDQKALWINAYNAYTLKLIVDFYPVDSIKSISSKLGSMFSDSKQWKVSDYKASNNTNSVIFVAGNKYSLNDIEHKILRPKFNDYRIHFAIVCAAISCPKLQSFAFVGSKLDKQLNLSGKEFLSDQRRNSYDSQKNIAYLSKIFSWFKKDFAKNDTELVKVVAKYFPEKTAAQITKSAKVKYKKYNWKLNSKKLISSIKAN